MMHGSITIEFREVQIDGVNCTGWYVTVGDRVAEGLTYEEMLGLVAAVTMPERSNRRCLAWLETAEQREARKRHLDAMRQESINHI